MSRSTKTGPEIGRIGAALKELREQRLRLSQQAFAVRLGMSMNSVARFETGRIPEAQSLNRIAALAVETGNQDLAKVFAEAAMERAGIPIPSGEFVVGNLTYELRMNATESNHVNVLLAALRDPDRFGRELESWNRLRARIEAKRAGK
jgi:transcriptional regulator with XRE-family HTH domain